MINRIIPYIFLLIFILPDFIYSNDTTNLYKTKKLISYLPNIINGIDAEGEINFEDKNESNSASLTLRINKPDSCFAKIQSIFGVTGAITLFTRTNFIFYDVVNNRVIKGPSTKENIRILLRVNLKFDELVNFITGGFIFNDTNDSNYSIESLNNFFTLNYVDSLNNELKKFYINKISGTLIKAEYYDLFSKARKLLIEYSDFSENDNITFPNVVKITRPLELQTLTIKYSKINLKPEKFRFNLPISKNAKIIEWK